MSLKKVSKTQPELFKFSADNLQKANKEIKKYPKNRKASSVIALLYLAQNQNDNWIPLAAIKYVAGILDMPYIKVYEVVTFYSMFNLSPVGKYFVQVCTTTPCMIRGAKKNYINM
jgi:NADH:ubiquinone oxidoreductase subunit E